MKLRTLAPTIVLLLVTAACSGSLSMQEYFTELAEINEQFKDEAQEAEDLLPDSPDVDDPTAAFTEYLDSILGSIRTALVSMERLKPPSEIQEDHDRFISTQEELADGLERILEDVEAAGASADLEAIIAEHGESMSTAQEDADEACQALQDVAEEKDIDVDLCGSAQLIRAQDKAAQSSLRNGIAAAKTLFIDTDDYSQISASTLATIEAALTWVDSPEPSTAPAVVSVWSDGDMVYSSATLSDSGTCFWLRDDATSGITYGTGTADTCTGEDAASATGTEW